MFGSYYAVISHYYQPLVDTWGFYLGILDQGLSDTLIFQKWQYFYYTPVHIVWNHCAYRTHTVPVYFTGGCLKWQIKGYHYNHFTSKNPTIFNIIRWVAGLLGRTTHGPSVWCSKYYVFFTISCKILCKNLFNLFSCFFIIL